MPEESKETAVKVAIVEDEANLRELYADLLTARGYDVSGFATIAAAEDRLATSHPDVLILDVQLPDGDGLALLGRLRKDGIRTPVIVTTAFGTLERAVEALRSGAMDFLVKPFPNERLLGAVGAAAESGRRLTELELRAGTVEANAAVEKLVGSSGGLRDVVELLPRIAASEATVLLRGESGTGKEMFARTIHACSRRMDGPFVAVNCAALPPSLLESELFGFERGAFTGAHARRKGHVEAAEGGTLFLDEIGDMPIEAQARLLRVLQEREVTRIGGREPVRVDVRIVAATHRKLEQLVEQGSFRADLLYRLAVVPITLPALRERPQDIPGLVDHFLVKHAARHGLPAPRLESETLRRLQSQPWPGNVRELENLVERAVVMGRFPTADAVPTTALSTPASSSAPLETVRDQVVPLRAAVAEAERGAIMAALRVAAGNKAEAARLLGVSYKTLFNKLHELGIREELKFE
jgi:DNA-binding NtrC family response regulator